ncbi:hypothetical protein [Clostridioides difficile]|uniref:hypothetical protein n=1 Tax=Clostridioides difficile TaxID=1496 RepID=UPI0010349BB7|nr:hypothetical protein [Clostridioides difficile]MDM9944023.1 hypothetical protein [Clostridioides difficile]
MSLNLYKQLGTKLGRQLNIEDRFILAEDLTKDISEYNYSDAYFTLIVNLIKHKILIPNGITELFFDDDINKINYCSGAIIEGLVEDMECK